MEQQWGLMYPKKERRGRRSELPEEIAKKLKSCSVTGCENWRDISAYTTYHCFPTGDKNQQRWNIWTSLVQKSRGELHWVPFRGSLVCSAHFRPHDFVQDPNQKRRKLMKNAIPSIFPTFNVDLDDPSYAVALDDSNDGAEGEGYQEDEGGNGYSFRQNGYHEEEAEEDDYYEYDQDQEIRQTCQVKMNYEDDDDEGYENTEEVRAQSFQAQSLIVTKTKPKPLPKLTPAATATGTKRSLETYSNVEFVKKKYNTANTAAASSSVRQGQQALNRKPPLAFKGTPTGNGYMKTFEKQPQMNVFNGNVISKPRAFGGVSSNSKLYDQLCKAVPKISWNPDLEIELVETQDESVDSLKQRIEELETENDALKLKYGKIITALQRRLREQDRTIQSMLQH